MEPAWAWHVLGLAPGASPDDVRRAFRLASQLLHPDRVADLADDVRAEAHRRMVEVAEAYRVATALAKGGPPPPPRAHGAATGPLDPAGAPAAALLAEATAALARVAPPEHFRAGRPTHLDRADNTAVARQVVRTLEQVADAWPGTREGDRARALLVSSAAARCALSARERAGHLVLVVDPTSRDAAWESLDGRDELAVAQVVYAHPTAVESLRRKARSCLVELGDWSSLAADDDPDIRQIAAVQLLLRDARTLVERAAWVSRRDRASYDADVAEWHGRLAAARTGLHAPDLLGELTAAETALRLAGSPQRARSRA